MGGDHRYLIFKSLGVSLTFMFLLRDINLMIIASNVYSSVIALKQKDIDFVILRLINSLLVVMLCLMRRVLGNGMMNRTV